MPYIPPKLSIISKNPLTDSIKSQKSPEARVIIARKILNILNENKISGNITPTIAK